MPSKSITYPVFQMMENQELASAPFVLAEGETVDPVSFLHDQLGLPNEFFLGESDATVTNSYVPPSGNSSADQSFLICDVDGDGKVEHPSVTTKKHKYWQKGKQLNPSEEAKRVRAIIAKQSREKAQMAMESKDKEIAQLRETIQEARKENIRLKQESREAEIKIETYDKLVHSLYRTCCTCFTKKTKM